MSITTTTSNRDTVSLHYKNKTVLVTGGASFISSHLVEELVALGADVRVVDDFSSGRIEHLANVIDQIAVGRGDLRDRQVAADAVEGADIVFHLAADHGGRGYIDTHQVECLGNMGLDHTVFTAAGRAGVGQIIHASSACAYPTILQNDSSFRGLLSEEQAGFDVPGSAFSDGAYGWAKLMGEYQLAAVTEQFGCRGVSCRIFTAYGERENESHAVMALIAKALGRLDPFPVWGDGNQTRNFTHVADTVTGMLLAGAHLPVRGSARFDVVNVGTSHHHTINELLEEIFHVAQWRPRSIDYQLDQPVGVKARAADCTKCESLLGWHPEVSLADGVARTYRWYERARESVRTLDDLLMVR